MSVPPPAQSDPIVPFWDRLPEITRYPAHMSAMITIVILALGNLAIFLPFGQFLVLLVTVALYRYAFECLRATANGYMEPPELMQSTDSSLGWKQIWLMVIFMVAAIIGVAVFGPKLGVVLVLFLGICLPGATMTLAMDESLSSALNPATWIAIFTRIGWPYLAVVGLCLVILTSQRYAAAMAAGVLPLFIALIVVGVISNYALVMTFHLMGYLIYQYHDAVGFEPAAPQMVRALAKPDPDQDVLDEVTAFVRDGKPENATELLRGHLRSRGGTPAVHTQYRKLLRLMNDRDELLRHGQEYLNILMAQDKSRLALEILRECQTIDPGFGPTDAEQITQLAGLAAHGGQPELALRLLSGFHKRFPKSKDIPKNYLLVATLLHERMNQDEKALSLLKYLKANYPDDSLMPEIDERLAMIERIMTSAMKSGAKAQGKAD
jgi:tetratricopeptide (TPR) repeat protein